MWKLLCTKSTEKCEPSVIPSVQMWKLLDTKSKDKSPSVSRGTEPSLLKGQMCTLVHHVKAAPRSTKEATMDSTILSSLVDSERGSSTRKGLSIPRPAQILNRTKWRHPLVVGFYVFTPTSLVEQFLMIHSFLLGNQPQKKELEICSGT